jgi:hypothetical protein
MNVRRIATRRRRSIGGYFVCWEGAPSERRESRGTGSNPEPPNG